jgi:hypothetical protein
MVEFILIAYFTTKYRNIYFIQNIQTNLIKIYVNYSTQNIKRVIYLLINGQHTKNHI